MRLEGKRGLVTGGSSGIGQAIVEAFVRAGATVVIAARNAERGRQAAAAHDGSIHFVSADVSDPGQAESLVTEAISLLGGVDILVNNAGSFPVGPLTEPTEESFQEAFDVNVKGPYFVSAYAAKDMIPRGHGKIINITTMAASVGIPGIGVYSASKAALYSLTQTMAAELGPYGINVNAIAPGPIPTPMTANIQDAQDQFASAMPARRKGRPDEIASAAVFLSSDESDCIHGDHLMVDGGYVAV